MRRIPSTRFMLYNHRAKAALTALNKAHPDLNKVVDAMAFSAYSKSHASWPEHILLPSNAWLGISAHLLGVEPDEYQVQRSKIVALSKSLRFLGTWAKTQGIYRFDPTIYDALIGTPLTGNIPSSALQRMPEWCMYLETPGLVLFTNIKIHGCWIMNEYVADDSGKSEIDLSILLDLEVPVPGLPPFMFNLPLDTEQSLEDVVQTFQRKAISELGAMFAHDIEESTKTLQKNLQAILSLTLYICTQKDFSSAKSHTPPTNPLPERKKGAMRVFAPSAPANWDVGVRMGSAIRRALEHRDPSDGSAQTRGKPRPHMRGFHWHGFRVGKAKDSDGAPIPAFKRELIVKFLPPTGVNIPDDLSPADLPAVIRPVK